MQLLVITPFKNEEKTLRSLIEIVSKQDRVPDYWVLVDDASTDNSASIVKYYEKSIPFIHYLKKEGDTGHLTGGNVVKVFEHGLMHARKKNFTFELICKLDADLSIDNPDFFEFMIGKFQKHPSLGIASGNCYLLKKGKKVIESPYRWHTEGKSKFYRKSCLEAIGGLKPIRGWDGIDNIMARHHGYITEKFFEQGILHLYPTQTRKEEGGAKLGLKRLAEGYQNRAYPFYMFILKSLKLTWNQGVFSGTIFLMESVRVKLYRPCAVSHEEKIIVRRFLMRRWFKKLAYTDTSGTQN